MAAPEKSKKLLFKVNLFVHKGEKPKLYIQAFSWLLSSGRFIVIFVEIIVIAAFVYRYKLDNDISDVNTKIKEQEPYIQSLQNEENTIRQVQLQLQSIKVAKSNNPSFSPVIQKIADITPTAISLTNITFDRTQNFPETDIIISGVTPSNLDLSAFLTVLKKDPYLAQITLSNISFKGSTDFTITGKLNIPSGGQS